MNMKRFLLLFVSATLFACAGCNTFHATQQHAFCDNDGNILTARYGALEKPYTYYITSPVNGVKLPCQDRNIVKLKLPHPNDSWITCYIRQNFFSYGTAYGTRDDKWVYVTMGLKCQLWVWDPDRHDYCLVFEGSFANSEED